MSNTKDVKLYYRLLKYPLALAKRRPGPMRICYNLGNGGHVTIESPEVITGEDLEKMYAAIYIAQKGTRKSIVEDDKTVTIGLLMFDIAKITNNHNYKHIINSIKRISKVTITYSDSDQKKGGITHLLYEAKWDETTGEVEITFNRKFYYACLKQALTLNLDMYVKLSDTEKNLYSFIISNSSSVFSEDLLTSRAGIQAARSDKARSILTKTLDGLVAKKVITAYSREKKDGKWLYTLQKRHLTVRNTSTAGGKNFHSGWKMPL